MTAPASEPKLEKSATRPVRTRFAPSPTGYVHIGSLRTALFSFLQARHNGGVHMLRIEDTDQNRLVEGSIENLLRVMRLMGVEFDEGYYLDDTGQIQERGSYGPYLQSRRIDLYQEQVKVLLDKQAAYYCFCHEARLEGLRKEQVALKKPPMYDRHCRNFTPDQVQAEMARLAGEGRKPVVRQAIPEGQTVLHDLIYGDITFDHKILDDQVLLKSDGFPTYHLAVVIDDHFMEISHVLRGEEWISSTPKHLLLYQAFGWQPTEFAHLPLILNQDKSKLSKRQGDVSVEDFLAAGYLKPALLNFVAFLGWNPKTEKELFSLEELIQEFDLNKVNKSAAIFDRDKLDWMNGLYIRSMSAGELLPLVVPYWAKAGIISQNSDGSLAVPRGQAVAQSYVEGIINLEKDRLHKLSDITSRTSYFFQRPEYDGQLLVWKKSTPETTRQVLAELAEFLGNLTDEQWRLPDLEEQIKAFIVNHNYDNGTVLWPLRVALSGLDKSPGPFDLASLIAQGLGKQEVIERILEAKDKLL